MNAAPIDDFVVPVDLGTTDSSGLVSCALARPGLRWRLDARRDGVVQTGYEVQRSPDGQFGDGTISGGWIDAGDPFGARLPGPALASRETAWCRVRARTDRGITGWSAPLRIEGGLFHAADWIARPISPAFNRDRPDPAPVVILRKAFAIAAPVRSARLYVTALGVQECRINGKPVSLDLLEPGWTAYDGRLTHAAYDVTDLLGQGDNVLSAEVADGWWRGNLTWTPRRAVYGATTALLAQLELVHADGRRETIASDESWRGSTGDLREADLYNGCLIDLARDRPGWRLPGFDDSGWSPVIALPLPAGLDQRAMPPVREVMRFDLAWEPHPDGTFRVDCGQNLTGYLRIHVEARGECTMTVRHAEVLESDGALHTAALRSARATDAYRFGSGTHVLAPRFTCHGFRHAGIAISGDARIVRIEACVLSSDLRRTGHFECSDERLNRLHENIVWSQRGNFISIPTDCPQRDERLGWTGDIQVFSPTACTLFDARAFLASWLRDLALEQAPDGQVPSTVPNVIQGHPYEYGGVGWADAAVLVPWALYEAYGDRDVLARQFGSMKAWVDWGLSRLDEGVWLGDFHLGDWLDPGAPPESPELATTDRDYIASCYLSFSAGIVARSAALLGNHALAQVYARQSQAVAAATWRRWSATASRTQAGCAMAIAFGIVPRSGRDRLGARLAEIVEASQGRIATGFLGTPLVLPALTMTGQDDAAFRLLLNTQAPGWLYQVLHGATTMWERWDAIRPDGTIHSGAMAADDAEQMISFNHYAYGCVGAWLYRSLAGIAPDIDAPGYRRILFAPRPGGGIDRAAASIETPFGGAAIAWRLAGATMAVELEIPPGAQGRFTCPAGWRLVGGDAPVDLGSGSHTLRLDPA